jgi:hypothetical protein
MQEHFPGSVLADDISDCEIVLPPGGINHTVLVDSRPWLNQAFLTLTFKQSDKNKCPGPDGFCPIVLCHLPDKAKVAIIEIYNAVIELKYTPLLWQASDIVFLPKPGKDDYTDKRTFQPISLMLFLFKALERLVKWHMEEHMKPFHPDQHAFRKGHCTENALSQMADTIECGILRGESALDVFLDIKGAFDNLTSNTIANGMKQHDIHDDIIAWQKNYLQSRYCSVKGSEQIFKLVKGTGQGGILSPSLWNFVMDSFLYKYTLAGTAEVIGALVIVARPTEGGTRI